jgi:hypothetical protein
MSTQPTTPTTTPTTTPQQQGRKRASGWLLLAIILAFVSFILFVSISDYQTKKEADKAEADKQLADYNATHPPAPAVIVEKVGMVPTLYNFSDYFGGCAPVDITAYNFNWYGKGGDITVCPPKAACFTDKPGNTVKTHYTPGHWRFCKKAATSTGVEVWQ